MSVATLDYPKTDIRLHVTSKVERELRIRSVDKERETVEWIESLKPGLLYDIGANVGAYSFVAAANGHKVYAFEPPGPTFDRLEDNMSLNPRLGARIFPFAVLLGDENRNVRFSYSSQEPGAALHRLGYGPQSECMPMVTLDSYVQEKNLQYPDYLKIDTDGCELRILVGAQECLEHTKSVQVEIDPSRPDATHIPDFLFSRGFAETLRTRHEWSGIENVRFDRYEAVG